MTKLELVRHSPIPVTTDDIMQVTHAPALDRDLIEEAIKKVQREMAQSQVWRNDLYQVIVRALPPDEHDIEGAEILHLSIRRLDQEPIHDWRHLQEIKNQLVGRECEAVEIYPAESRLVDTTNQFHLWAFTDPNVRVPIGWKKRMVAEEGIPGKTKQRRRT